MTKIILKIAAWLTTAITVGIVVVLLVPSIEFFTQVSQVEFLFGTRWPQRSGADRPDRGRLRPVRRAGRGRWPLPASATESVKAATSSNACGESIRDTVDPCVQPGRHRGGHVHRGTADADPRLAGVRRLKKVRTTELARGGPGSIDAIEIDAASHDGGDEARAAMSWDWDL